jgi:5-methylcytosine-specific restriction protein B
LGFNRQKYFSSCKIEIMLWADLKGADDKYIYYNFDKKDDDPDFRVYKIPIEAAIRIKDDIYQNYLRVLEHLASKHKKKLSASSPEKEIEQKVLKELLLSAISDQKEHEELLEGMKTENSNNDDYPLAKCSEDTGFDIKILKKWARAVDRKGQAVLYGPPGLAKHIWQSIWQSI